MANSTLDEIIKKDDQYCVHGFGYVPIAFVEGKGAILKDVTGKEYIDFGSQSMGSMGIGFSQPKVIEAIERQLKKVIQTSPWFLNTAAIELAEKLAKITPAGLNKCFFTCGGSLAVETALRGAMKITKKKEVISLYLAYHGSTIGTINLGQPWWREGYPKISGFMQIPSAYCYRCFYGKEYPGCDFECARALESTIKYGSSNDVAAFILEPILGNGGHILPPGNEYFKIIRETCDRYGVLVIADEIQTCLGRTGKMWASDLFEFRPDILVAGKPLGGGMPMGAAIFREDILPPGFQKNVWHGFSFQAHPLSCAAASAAIDIVLEENFPERSAKMGEFMMERLRPMQERYELIGEIRGPGLYIGLELVKNRKTKEKAIDEALKVHDTCLERGLHFGVSLKPGYGNVIKFKPPMCIEDDQLTKGLDIFESMLSKVGKTQFSGAWR